MSLVASGPFFGSWLAAWFGAEVNPDQTIAEVDLDQIGAEVNLD